VARSVFSWSPPARPPIPQIAVGPTLPLRGDLLIRPLLRPDLDKRQAWPPFNDPLYLVWDMPRCSARENDGWFTQINDGRHRLAYAVEDPAGHMIGMVSLREISWNRSARLGISFSSQYVGRGLGTAAMKLFLPYYFLTLGFSEMVLDVAAANIRAVRCYQKLGFRHTGSHWQTVDGPLDPHLFEQPVYASLRVHFRWFWGRAEAEYYDMALRRGDWENL